MANDGFGNDGEGSKMRSSPLEALLVLELHRAMFRFNHAKTDEDRELLHKQVEAAERNLAEFERGINDGQVQGTKKDDNTGKTSTNMWALRQANHKSK